MTCLSIDGRCIEAIEGETILEVALNAGMYIPHLCWHPDLKDKPFNKSIDLVYQGADVVKGESNRDYGGCGLCAVEIEGKDGLAHACYEKVKDKMVVRTDTKKCHEERIVQFTKIIASHPHACLFCRQREGCSREPCSLNVPLDDRCCSKMGRCELEKLFDHLGFNTPLERFRPTKPVITDLPLFNFDYNLCVGCLRCVRICEHVRGVGSFAFTVQNSSYIVGFKKPTLNESACRFCGACAEVCPTGTIMDKELHWHEREKYLVPCKYACPAMLDVPAYLRAIAQKDFKQAASIIRETVIFGSILGRVCYRPCEDVCRRGQINHALAICDLKRFACDLVPPKPPEPLKPTGKKVAIVGAGPAGLTAGWFLRRMGHKATVFEQRSAAGGMLRWGIPGFRLPPTVLQEEISYIINTGVRLKLNTRVNDPAELRRDYDAVLIAVGLQRSKKLSIPGENPQTVYYGLEFLSAINSGSHPRLADPVLVIGGGNVAVDVAVSARKLGRHDVCVVCLESYDKMPAFEHGKKEAQDEGVVIKNGWGPVEITQSAHLKKVHFIRCVSVFDERGRFAPEFDQTDQMELFAQTVIVAIGQEAEQDLPVDVDGIFKAGDISGIKPSVIAAIASGRQAAQAIDKYLGGAGELPQIVEDDVSGFIGFKDDFSSMQRVDPVSLDQAIYEASRCLQCDLRLQIKQVKLAPEKVKLSSFCFDNVQSVPQSEGVLLLYDANKELILITGTSNIKQELQKYQGMTDRIHYFSYELDPYYTRRESELLQVYLQRHGRLPPGLEDLDGLY